MTWGELKELANQDKITDDMRVSIGIAPGHALENVIHDTSRGVWVVFPALDVRPKPKREMTDKHLFARTGGMLIEIGAEPKYVYILIACVLFGYTPETVTPMLVRHIKRTIYWQVYGGK